MSAKVDRPKKIKSKKRIIPVKIGYIKSSIVRPKIHFAIMSLPK